MLNRHRDERKVSGADGFGKQALEVLLVSRAAALVVDSVEQWQYGEIAGTLNSGLVNKTQLVALGSILRSDGLGWQDDTQITVTELAGLGVQDAQIAKCAMAWCAK